MSLLSLSYAVQVNYKEVPLALYLGHPPESPTVRLTI